MDINKGCKMIPTKKQRQQIQDLLSDLETNATICDNKFKRLPDEVNNDIAELTNLAQYFDKIGKSTNAEFIRKIARRLQYLEG